VERIVIDNSNKKAMKPADLIKALATNRALLAIIAASIVSLLSSLLMQSLNMYLYQDYFRNIAAMSVAGMMSTACTLLLAPFSGKIATKFGKKEASSVGLLVSSGVFAFLFMAKVTNPWVFCSVLLIANLGCGLFNLMMWAFVSDIIDYQTVQTGSNDGGTVYGLFSFARKIGQALAGGLGGFVISAIGYEVSVGGAAVVQTEAVTSAIYSIATGVPAVGYFVIALILIFWYPLSKKKCAEVKAKLDAMNAE
jgi:GPH family glycoside/pentoside/hexuronide:cation symporter